MKLIFLGNISEFSRPAQQCVFSEVFYGFPVGVWGVAFGFHLRSCGLSDVQIGLLISVGFFATACVSFFIGRLGDAIGYPAVTGMGCMAMCAAFILIALNHSFSVFFLSQLFYGFGLSCIASMEFPLCYSLIEDKHKLFVYNLLIALYFFSSIFGNLFAGGFSKLYSGPEPYRWLLLLCAGSYFCLGVLRSRLPKQAVSLSKDVKLIQVLQQKKVLSYLLFGFLLMTIFNIVMSMINLVLRNRYSMADITVGYIMSISSVSGCLIALLVPALTRTFRLETIAVWAISLQTLTLFSMSFSGPVLFSALVAVRTCTTNVIYATADSAMLRSISAESRGSYSGLRVSSNYIGMGVGSILAGILVAQNHYALLFSMGGVFGILMLTVYLRLCLPCIRSTEQET